MGEKMRRRSRAARGPDHRNLSKPGGFGGSDPESYLMCEREKFVHAEV